MASCESCVMECPKDRASQDLVKTVEAGRVLAFIYIHPVYSLRREYLFSMESSVGSTFLGTFGYSSQA